MLVRAGRHALRRRHVSRRRAGGGYWTDYLRDYIKSRDLEQPVKHGRIWRIVHDTTQARPAPALSKARAGARWCRRCRIRTAGGATPRSSCSSQRGDATVAPQLRQLAARRQTGGRRLHALWTLDGLDAIDAARSRSGRSPTSPPDVRAAAIRLSERWLARGRTTADAAAVLKLMDDANWTVRRQLAATVGALAAGRRGLERGACDADALRRRSRLPSTRTLSGLRGLESQTCSTRLMRVREARTADVVSMLAGAVREAANVAAVILARARRRHPSWQRTARPSCRASTLGLPSAGGGRAGAAVAARPGAAAPARPVSLPAEPALTGSLAADGRDRRCRQARRGEARLARQARPGRHGRAADPRAAAAVRRRGRLYKNICVGLPSAGRPGQREARASLVDSRYVTGRTPERPRDSSAGRKARSA